MNTQERIIYESLPSLIERVDPSQEYINDYYNDMTRGHEGGLEIKDVEEGHYYLVKVKGYPAFEPNRPHGGPHVENKGMAYRYFVLYIVRKERVSTGRGHVVTYLIDAFREWSDLSGVKYSRAEIYGNPIVNQPYTTTDWRGTRVWTDDYRVGYLTTNIGRVWWDITSYVQSHLFLNWGDRNPLEVKS